MSVAITSPRNYITVDWAALGPTAGTAQLVDLLRDSGQSVIDGGQGAMLALPETDPVSIALNQNLSIKTGPYNNAVGGTYNMRATAASYLSDIYRVPVTHENTYLLEAQGRAAVKMMYEEAARRKLDYIMSGKTAAFKPELILTSEHWDTLAKIAGDCHMAIRTYDNRNEDPSDAIITTLDNCDLTKVAAITLNYPLNPTSQEILPEQTMRVLSWISEANKKEGVDIHVIFDMPYAFACNYGQKPDGGLYLKTGVETTLHDVKNINWSVVVSMSKLFALAKTGATIMAVNPERARDIRSKLARNGLGLARIDSYLGNVAHLLEHGNRQELWKIKAGLRDQFAQNCSVLVDTFGSRVVPGGNNMLRLLETSAADVFNHEVMCCDGKNRILKNGDDVVTWLVNEHGAAVVNAGLNKKGDLLLRFAGREKFEVFKSLVQKVDDGLKDIAQSPVAAPV